MLLVDDMPYFALFVMRNMVDRLRRMNEQWLSIRPAPFQGSSRRLLEVSRLAKCFSKRWPDWPKRFETGVGLADLG